MSKRINGVLMVNINGEWVESSKYPKPTYGQPMKQNPDGTTIPSTTKVKKR